MIPDIINTTQLIVGALSGYYGNNMNLTANLTNDGTPLSGKLVNFTVNGSSVGNATTNTSGIATLPYTITLTTGIYPILAQFQDTIIYSPSNGTNNLTVNGIPTQIIVNPISGYYNDNVNLTANLTDNLNNLPLNSKLVNFTVNGSSVGNATTNTSGIATLPYTITLTTGIYPILAQFAGDTIYSPSNGTNNLTVLAVDLTVNSVSGSTVANPGSPITVNVNLNNSGPIIPTTNVAVEFLLSTDYKYDPYVDYKIGNINYAGLPSGVSVTKTATFNLPSNIPLGGYYILAYVDWYLTVAESNEANNFLAATLPNIHWERFSSRHGFQFKILC